MVFRKLAEARERLQCFFMATNFDQPTRRFAGEEREEENNACKHEMHATHQLVLGPNSIQYSGNIPIRNQPLSIRLRRDVDRRAPRREVRQHDTDIYSARECTHTEPSNCSWSGLRKIRWCDHSSLPNTNTCDEATSIHHSDTPSACTGQEYGDSDRPDEAQETCCPKPSDFISEEECN
jgi:hypothetical protein